MPARFTLSQIARPALLKPFTKAAKGALIYILLCSFYILLSGHIAASIAESAEQLRLIESLKGIAFILVTGLLFFAISYTQWQRIRNQQHTITTQEHALLLHERRTVAAMCSATLAHDLNNLLMALSGLVHELKGKEGEDAHVEKIRRDLEGSISNLSGLTKRISSAAQNVLPQEAEQVDLADALPKATALVRKHPDVQHRDIIVADVPQMSLRLNRVLLEQALLNMIINAAQATGKGGQVEIRCREEEQSVALEVHDNGPGIPAHLEKAIFDPCFTTKSDGTGVGLLAVKAFASACEAAVDVGQSDLGGAFFRIRIPKATS